MTPPFRVLVVDDDFMVARLHRKFVERVPGFVVVDEARTGEEALSAVRDHRPDLVLLDIYLPDVTGLEVLRRLRSAGQEVDVLVVSAARDVDTVQEAFRGGAVQYLIKPFTAEDLRDRLLEFLRRRRSVDAADGELQVRQDQVDALFGSTGGRRAATELPKGLAVQTMELVGRALRARAHDEQPTVSATECAEEVGLARVSVRRYLEHLVVVGQAEVSLKYGRAGRPERRYRWTGR